MAEDRVLLDFRCPKDRSDLLLFWDVDGDDEGRTWRVHHFRCEAHEHVYAARPDGMGDHVPVDEDDDGEAGG